MKPWPLEIAVPQGVYHLPGPGHFAVLVNEYVDDLEVVTDEVLAAAYRALDINSVGWVPEDGGLLGNLPAWENILLATQWHAPAALTSLETRVREWCKELGYDGGALSVLFSRQPALLSEEDRLLMGWLRQMMSRPQVVVMRADAIPRGRLSKTLLQLIEQELASSALLVVDERIPEGYQPLTLAPHGKPT
jgi:ABC-type proline/glycine betaine transport system ATPase subunit